DPPVAESMALNISDGDITIYSDGYVQNGDFHAFVSTDSSRYRITGSAYGDHPLMINTKTYNDLIPAGTTSVYLIFDNMTLTGGAWCSALCIDAYSDLDLYVENVGTTTIRGDNHPAFAVGQESGSITIAITSDGGFETFRCERDDESTPTVYGSAVIQSVTMNGISVDGNGGSLEPSPAEVSDGPLTIVGYTAIARFICHNDPTHVVELEATVTYADTAATCEADAYRTYTATVLFGDKEYAGNRITTFEDTALGHSVSDWIETLEPTCTEKGSRHKVCTVCDDELETEEPDALGHDLAFIEGDWTCETGGTVDHYKCNRCNKLFDLEENEIGEEDLLLPPGHDWDEPVFTWTRTSDGYTVTATFTCLSNSSHVMEVPAEVELNGSTYVATVVVDDEPYEDQHGAPDLSVANGRIYIRPNDYIQNSAHSGNYTSFVSSENDPYVISGATPNNTSPQVVDIFNFSQYNDGSSGTYDGRWNDSVEDFYFRFDDLTVSLSGDYPVFNIRAEKDVNLYITLDSAVSLSGLSLFRAQGLGWTPTVNIYVTTQGYAFANSGSGNLYRAESGATVKLYIDGVRVDASGAAMAPEISLNDGRFFVNASGYAMGYDESCLNTATPFVSSQSKPYVIANQELDYCDNIISVYQTDSGISTTDIYIKLSNVTIEAGPWCSLFLIVATNTVNIHLIIEGNVTFIGGDDQQIFSSQGSGSPTVRIYIDESGGTFTTEITNGLTYAASGTIDVQYI
ncbi:MAG: hypothetical protein J6U39_02375, partial [Clostridia bacterium]|nr:hypothetical protein [Clostridia bacterium]